MTYRESVTNSDYKQLVKNNAEEATLKCHNCSTRRRHRNSKHEPLTKSTPNRVIPSIRKSTPRLRVFAICLAAVSLLSRGVEQTNGGRVSEDGKFTTIGTTTAVSEVLSTDEASRSMLDAFAHKSSCYFVAIPGFFFNRSVSSQFETNLQKDDLVKVYFADSQLESWLTYDDSTRSLSGIPKTNNLASQSHNLVIVLYRDSLPRLNLPCILHVTDDVTKYDDARGGSSLKCASYEPITVFSLTLVAPLNKEQRSRVFQRLCGKIDAHIPSCDSIVVEDGASSSRSRKTTRLVQSSRSRSASSGDSTVEVWWPIACGSDSLSPSSFSEMSKAADNGTLSELFGGIEVLEWKIGNRADDKARFAAKSLRIGQKRHFSKVFQHKSAGSRTSIYQLDSAGFRRRFRRDSESSGDDFDADPGVNEYESKVNERTSKPSLSHLQSPTVAPTSAGTPTLSQDNPPTVNVRDLELQGTVGTLIVFKLPGNTFVDHRDGGMERLKLNLYSIGENHRLDSNPWLRLDTDSLSLYGVPPDKLDTSELQKFLLEAIDSSNFTATTTIKVSLSSRRRNKTSHRFVVSSVFHNSKMSKEIEASLWMRHLSQALFPTMGSKSAPNPPEERLTLLRHDRGERRITMTWSYNDLNAQIKCNMAEINRVWTVMTGERVDALTRINSKVKATPSFSDSFEPDFSVDKVKVVLNGICSSPVTSSYSPTWTYPTAVPTRPSVIAIPRVLDKSKVLKLNVDIGMLTRTKIDTSNFELPEMAHFKLVTADGRTRSTPPWLRVDNDKRQIVTLPLLSNFEKTINFIGEWRGGLVATVGRYESDPLNITVIAKRMKVYEIEAQATHKFQLDILNYNSKTFRVKEFAQILDAIRKLYGDSDTSNIYVYAPNAEEDFEISWTNITTAVQGSCNRKQITRLKDILIGRDGKIQRGFELFLEKDGFEVGSIQMVEQNQCTLPFPTTSTVVQSSSIGSTTLVNKVSTTVVTPSLTLTTQSTANPDQAGNKAGTTTTKNGRGEDQNGSPAKQSSVSSAMIIMITLFVCAILLIILCCVKKFRTERKMKEVHGAGGGSSLGGKLMVSDQSQSGREFTYKRGTPIVFDGELDQKEMMEIPPGNNLHPDHQHTTTSPLINDRVIQQNQTSSFFQATTVAVPPPPLKHHKDDAIIDLTGTNAGIESEIERPPPPPYLLKSAAGSGNGYDH